MVLLWFSAFFLLHLTGGSENPGSSGNNVLPGRDRRDVNAQPGSPQPSLSDLQDEIRNLQSRMTLIEKATRFHTFVNVGQKYYVSDGHKKNIDDGMGWCRDVGAKLVVLSSEEDSQALAKVLNKIGSSYAYVGATDREKEGLWFTLDHLPLSYSKWRPGEPNNYGKEDCAIVDTEGFWYDVACNIEHLIICEIV